MKQATTSNRWALAALSLSMLLSSLGTSIANVGLPTLAQAFHASFQQVQWIVLAYLLAITTLIVSTGKLGDLLGRRRLLLGGIALFSAASLLCGFAPTLEWLIAARALQGLGAASMMALTTAFVSETVPKEKTGSAMGLLGTMSAIGTALGPSLGGLLVAHLDWRFLFFITLPLGLLTGLLALRHLPTDPVRTPGSTGFDALGTLLLALTLAAYALAMTARPGPSPWLLAAALLGAGLFLAVQKRAAFPLVQLALFRARAFSTSLAMNAVVSTVMMATLVVGPFYLAHGLALDATQVGLVMAVGPVLSILLGVVAGRVVDRWGAQRMVVLGLAGMVAGAAALALLAGIGGVAGYLVGILLITPGYQLFQAANNTSVMADVRTAQRGLISGMLSLSRNLGLITGASLMGAVFALVTGALDHATAQQVADGLRLTFALAVLLLGLALWLAWGCARAAQRLAAA